MPPDASASGLHADPEFHDRLAALGADPASVVPYKGRPRAVLDAKVAPARRQGIEVDFVQTYSHGKITRALLIFDPSMPPALQKQAVLVPGTIHWTDALVTAGLLAHARQRIAPGAYVECSTCREYGMTNACAECGGTGLVPSSNAS